MSGATAPSRRGCVCHGQLNHAGDTAARYLFPKYTRAVPQSRPCLPRLAVGACRTGTAELSDLSKSDLKNASVQQPPFMNRRPFLFVIPSEAEGSAVPRTTPGNPE